VSRRALTLAAALVAALAFPAAAFAHAALLRTSPVATRILTAPPNQVSLTFSEAVEPRFAIVSVTDVAGHRVTSGSPARSPTNPDTLVVPLRRLTEGWYLVYWRVISVDGHPVRNAFTFAVGPNPGPQPEFAIPSISETAATPQLVVARWITFLSIMGAIGLFALRMLIARPMVRRVRGTHLRALSIAVVATTVVGLVATPIYVLLATAQFALRHFWQVGALVPLLRVSAFGRGYLKLELLFALFALAAFVAIWVDRPEREQRSIAELFSVAGAVASALAVLLVPGTVGHAGQTSPRLLSIALDWQHLVAGSVWIGGLAGLLVVWRSLPVAQRVAGLVVCVPRFSNVAFVSVLLLVGTGIGASIIHLPTLGSLWQTSYGQALLVKIALLAVAVVLAAVNLLRTKPRLVACERRPELGRPTTILLRRLVAGETLLVAGAIAAAAVLSSLAPPAKALAKEGSAVARVGPGVVHRTITHGAYRLDVAITPNRAAVPNMVSVRITREGKPVRRAGVTTDFTMLDMEMPEQAYELRETAPGVYARSSPALVMVGHWGLGFAIAPPGVPRFNVFVVDHATG
jgi:copper transport protein